MGASGSTARDSDDDDDGGAIAAAAAAVTEAPVAPVTAMAEGVTAAVDAAATGAARGAQAALLFQQPCVTGATLHTAQQATFPADFDWTQLDSCAGLQATVLSPALVSTRGVQFKQFRLVVTRSRSSDSHFGISHIKFFHGGELLNAKISRAWSSCGASSAADCKNTDNACSQLTLKKDGKPNAVFFDFPVCLWFFFFQLFFPFPFSFVAPFLLIQSLRQDGVFVDEFELVLGTAYRRHLDATFVFTFFSVSPLF